MLRWTLHSFRLTVTAAEEGGRQHGVISMRHATYALLGLMMAFAALVFSGVSSQAATVGVPSTTQQTIDKDGLVQKVWHSRHQSHWRWGSGGGHHRHWSHRRWGSSGGGHHRHWSHRRWGSGY
jgi:hypothetical protein